MRKITLAVLFVLTLAAVNSFAQRITGSVAGQVLDPGGAAVPHAKITVSNAERAFKLEFLAGDDGTFVAPDLVPGQYKITIQHEGFKTYVSTVVVQVGITASITPRLELGQLSSIVTVEGAVVTVDTSRATVQGLISGAQIDRLPLNGRNFLDLATQEPGVQTVDGGTFDPTKNQMVGVSIGGRSGRSTRIQIDGVDITDETVGTTVANISNESIQEFNISQASLDPSTDLTSTGGVNIITKSGTNSLHGSGFAFFRDNEYSADQRLDKTKPTADKPPFHRRIYGGRGGGPVFKDKWFWNVDYEHNDSDSQRFTNTPNFPQFTGAFGVPLFESMASARSDWVITEKLSAFYRFQHDDNFGVTGFGGISLAAFSNYNNTNFHVAGVDYRTSRWTHSGRFSYVNFNNFILDANAAAGTPTTADPSGKPLLLRIRGSVNVGPNLLAPQQTFQDNKQSKYDGSVIFGRHTFAFGGEYNHIEQFVFAAFFGLAPRISASRNSTTRAFANTNPFGPGGDKNPLNYPVNQIVLGNGLGFFSEKPALGFPRGGSVNHRLGFYAHDTFRVTSSFTLNYGLRYNWNSSLSNHDLERTPVLGLFDPQLAGFPRRDANDFAPQAGFAWNVFGNGKTVIRGGAGIFYETNIFNNLLFDRVLNIPPGLGFDAPTIDGTDRTVKDPSTGVPFFDFSTDCTGLPGGSCLGAAIGQTIPFVQAQQQEFQKRSAALAANWPPPGVSPLFNQILDTEGSVLDPNYKTPYGIQFNIGIQHQIKPGLVLSVDYVRNRGVHFNQIRDRNRIGAANTLFGPAAVAAMNATFPGFDSTKGPGGTQCSDTTAFPTQAQRINCTINGGVFGFTGLPSKDTGATISDYAGNGLGAGSGVDGFAYSGQNRNFRTIGIIEPIGLSLYQALQVRLRGDLGSWGPLKHVTTNITYALGRFESTGGDQDFLSGSVFNDRPTAFFGPANEDRTHQIGFSFLIDFPWGFRVNTGTKIKSSLAGSLFLPITSGGADEIFFSDLDGDGVTADPLPDTNRGSFGRGVNGGNINTLINKFDSTVAGTLSPAGIALVQAGLFTQAQLTSLGAVIQSVQPAPSNQASNDILVNTDIRISKVFKIKERFTIEPMVECFNLFNVANYATLSSSLDGGKGDANGTPVGQIPNRVGAGSGSFAPGTQRAFQFGIRVSF